MEHKTLSWSLVVATYKREKILPMCLKLAAEQTRKPSEIIVVDASENWETIKQKIREEIAVDHPDIQWQYVQATTPSLTLQRNQGLELATADIVFLLDDDSLMYPDCAEKVMEIYEADVEKKVQGIQTSSVGAPPMQTEVRDNPKPSSYIILPLLKKNDLIGKGMRFINKNIFLMDTKINFIPYRGNFPNQIIPDNLKAMRISIVPLLEGFRMTYRREVISQEKFEPLLRYYAAGEDMDASYRVSLKGLLLQSQEAKIHHFSSSSGRLSRFQVSALAILNQAVFIRKNAQNLENIKQKFYFLTYRRVMAELLKDFLTRRWLLPQVRGILFALAKSEYIFNLSDKELEEWYPKFQENLLNS